MASDGQNFFKFFDWNLKLTPTHRVFFVQNGPWVFWGDGDFLKFFYPEFFWNGQKKPLSFIQQLYWHLSKSSRSLLQLRAKWRCTRRIYDLQLIYKNSLFIGKLHRILKWPPILKLVLLSLSTCKPTHGYRVSLTNWSFKATQLSFIL